ncbi:MAG: DEAD/DEAH box helicase family protein [Desulfobacteraceae bacterium]|nr:DEAD/DEAH box helicase family protein [Desulfobacteraceae bacterium]
MKAILRNRIYIQCDEPLKDSIEKELSYTIPVRISASEVRNVRLFDFKRVNSTTLSIPIGRVDLIPETHEIIDKRVYNLCDFHIKEGIKLRPSQQNIYDNIENNTIINAGCSFGKTFTGLAITEKLGQKTLIIVHTLKLMHQWVKEIDKVLGTKPGIIGDGQFNVEPDICIATNQTLTKKGTKELFNTFGTVIVDECLDYESRIDTLEEGLVKIGKIVNNKLAYHAKSWNGNTFEYKKITNWFKNPAKDWMIKFYTTNGILKCTLNHSIYDMYGVKKPAEYFNENDYIMAEKTHKSLNLINTNLDILLGCILGDGSISNDSQGIRIKITNGEKQKGFLQYKKDILNNITNMDLCKGKSGYCDNAIYSFGTLSFIDLYDWKEKLYGNNSNKVFITQDIADLLSIESWSLIYQDDGSISSDSIRFHIYMDEHNLKILATSLENLFGIKPRIYKDSKRNLKMLGLIQEDSKIFINKIEHLIHSDLAYKKGSFGTGKVFNPIKPIKGFENHTLVKIKSIDFEPATYNNRYNITVEGNHNYLANGKLVGNCHHIPATTFNSIVDKFRARYKIGLSATLRRKDQKQFLITNYITHDNIIKPAVENSLTPKVIVIKSDIRMPHGNSWQERVTKLVENTDYIAMLYDIVQSLVKEGHVVLTIANRVGLLKTLNDITDKSGLIVGSSEDTDQVIKDLMSGKLTSVFGSTQIMSEGISVNILSAVLLGVPINSDITLEQVIGRVIRIHEGKKDPLVIDIVLKGDTPRNQFRTRKQYYMSKNYEITEIQF